MLREFVGARGDDGYRTQAMPRTAMTMAAMSSAQICQGWLGKPAGRLRGRVGARPVRLRAREIGGAVAVETIVGAWR